VSTEATTDLVVEPVGSDADVEACARMMAASEPWLTLRRDLTFCRRLLSDASRERYLVRVGGALAGFVVINMRGAFVGYIQTICIAAEFRSRGIGARLMEFAERRIFQTSPNVFLCVSSFNLRAQSFYQRLGYAVIGEIADFLVAGHSEILMRKTLGPISTFRPTPEASEGSGAAR